MMVCKKDGGSSGRGYKAPSFCIEGLLQNPQNGEVKALSVSVPGLDVLIMLLLGLAGVFLVGRQSL